MEKITPHLWFDKEAKEAAAFYISIFENSSIKTATTLSGTPSGDVDLLTIQLLGQEFSLISAGPYFKLNPSVSFLVACTSTAEVERLWERLSPGGKALMELGTYPFSQKYGWIQDKFDVSWQLMDMSERPVTQRIIPTIMFIGDQAGNAEEAMKFYTSLFHEAKIERIMRHGAEQPSEKEGTVAHGSFVLEGQQFAAMDSAQHHEFALNEAISFIVHCDTQEEIDYYWDKLSAYPASEQCGWLKDRFGLSWQIVPTMMDEMMQTKDKEKLARVTQAFLAMKKFDLATLQRAYDGTVNA